MINIEVCVGSSCHMKGSYQVIKTFEKLIKEHSLGEQLHLKASFCQGRCMKGISVLAGGAEIDGVGFANAEEVFYEKIMPMVKEI